MVLPVKGTVKDISVSSATGAMDTARYTLPLEHVLRTQQALARCTRPLALAQRTQLVLTARNDTAGAKKIHETGNCELREIQHRNHKVQCQRCYSVIEAAFQVRPCRAQLNMSEEMFSSIRQKFKQLVADAYMTLQEPRGARHGAQPWQKTPLPGQGVHAKKR